MRWVIAILVTAVLVIEAVVVGRVWTQHLTTAAEEKSQCPTVPGTVTSSQTTTDDDYAGDLVFLIRFSYEVSGVKYSGGQDWSVQQYGQERRYPKGAAVTVYYNPEKPKDAVVEPTLAPEWDSWQMLPYAGWVIAIMGSIFVWMWAAERVKSPSSTKQLSRFAEPTIAVVVTVVGIITAMADSITGILVPCITGIVLCLLTYWFMERDSK